MRLCGLKWLVPVLGVAAAVAGHPPSALAETAATAFITKFGGAVPSRSAESGHSAAIVAGSGLGDGQMLLAASQAEDGLGVAYLTKRDGAGALLWRVAIGRVGNEGDNIQLGIAGLAVDAAGTSYLAGTTNQPTHAGGGHDLEGWIGKVGAHGNLEWLRQFGSSGDDQVGGLVLDPAGDIIVAGTWLAKYRPSGEQVWKLIAADGARFVRVDAAGNPILAGGDPSGAIWVAKHRATDGQRLWRRAIPGFGSLIAVAVDAGGNVVVAGGRVARLDPNGVVRWSKQPPAETVGLVVYPGGDAVVAGAGFLRRYAATGAARWTQTFDAATYGATRLAAAAGGGVVLAGTTSDGGSAWAAKYDGSGSEQWRALVSLVPWMSVTAMAIDEQDDVLLAGDHWLDPRNAPPWLAKIVTAP